MRVGMVGTAAGELSVAVGREGGWVPLLTVAGADRLGPVSADLLAFLSAGEQVRELAEELVSAAPPAEPSPLLAPPFRPLAFRDCSLWEEHMIAVSRGLLRLRESAAGVVSDGFERLTRRPFPRLRPRPLWYEQPLYYKGNPATFIGDGETVRWPAYAQALDYELEIGVVIARDGSDLTPDEALAVVGGFVLVNDFSARDVQFREMVEGLMGRRSPRTSGPRSVPSSSRRRSSCPSWARWTSRSASTVTCGVPAVPAGCSTRWRTSSPMRAQASGWPLAR